MSEEFGPATSDHRPAVPTSDARRKSPVASPHIVLTPDQWPRSSVFCFCPDCRDVVGIPKAGPANCPNCSRNDLRDIFTEMAERMEKTWAFFEATRAKEGSWLFKHAPEDSGYSLWGTLMALGYYAEVRCLGFEPPWLDNWRESPIITRESDGSIMRNDVIYHTRGFGFHG